MIQFRQQESQSMAQQHYESHLQLLRQQGIHYATLLPERLPQRPPALSRFATIQALRQTTTTYAQTYLILGWGDGQIADLFLKDPLVGRRQAHVVVLPEEAQYFAQRLAESDFQELINRPNLTIHLIDSEDTVRRLIGSAFPTHQAIASLAGVVVIDQHPLSPAAATQRAAWRPLIDTQMETALDSLGNDVFDTFTGARHAMLHGDHLITAPRISTYLNLYQGQTAIVVASGPSATEHLADIAAVQDETIVIVADSMLKACYDAGIDPDFVAVVERPQIIGQLFSGQLERSTKTRLVTLPVAHPDVVTPYAETSRLIWWWAGDNLYPWIDPTEPSRNSGRSTGTLGVALAGVLGCERAILVGHDLAMKGDQTHSADVHGLTQEVMERENQKYTRTNPNVHQRLIDVPGNNDNLVTAVGVWNIFRQDIEGIIRCYPKTSFININAGTDTGAMIRGTEAGCLPSATGATLERQWPDHNVDEEAVLAFRDKCRAIPAIFESITERFTEELATLDDWRALDIDRPAIDTLSRQIDLADIAGENQYWFRYVFRAALHNLQLRLHYNTHVATELETNWNQIQVMRMYMRTMLSLCTKLATRIPGNESAAIETVVQEEQA